MLQIGARTHLTPMHERQRSMKRPAYVDRSMNVSTTANNSPNMPRRSLFQMRMAIGRNDGKKFPERIMNPQRRRRRREGVNRSFIRISTALLWEFHRKYFNTRWYSRGPWDCLASFDFALLRIALTAILRQSSSWTHLPHNKPL